jgi:transcriptional regulator with XRE-family HTH domain
MDIEARKLFGQAIRRIRTHKKMTLASLAEQAGTCKGYLSGVENGKCSPPFVKLTVRICTVLDMNPEGLLLLSEVAKAPDEVLRIPAYRAFRDVAVLTTNLHLLYCLGQSMGRAINRQGPY